MFLQEVDPLLSAGLGDVGALPELCCLLASGCPAGVGFLQDGHCRAKATPGNVSEIPVHPQAIVALEAGSVHCVRD
eukprot:940562-Rhodomonas_salina.1